ncbi:MAG TPA: YfhL family 4Fe-4S dicluster ferredoxin [Bacteroidales bacterium]|nr:YfhL family 4Fe-4S dicluster ferredoxin [Bacteroidales bacterium]HNS45599.1 YfhL family 4Fe-4S dicluster ferredoxin [Bacteroidales bacterium]
MALMITSECAVCGMCVDECPNQAISMGSDIYEINPALCTECVGFYDEPQCVSVCPVDAIVPNPAYSESREELLKKKKHIHGE